MSDPEMGTINCKKIMYLIRVFVGIILCCSPFHGCYADANQPQTQSKKQMQPNAVLSSSFVFPLSGNVFPMGYYYATVDLGDPPKPYYLDVDSGSDLTWVQCDAPCKHCRKQPHPLYKPNNNQVPCKDPACAALYWPERPPCKGDTRCEYEVAYADQGSSKGMLVKDVFRLTLTSGTIISSNLVFGCGFDQQAPETHPPPFVDGVLGLGFGKSSIIQQLNVLGLTRRVIGHCLSGKGGGYLFFGDNHLPPGITWEPFSSNTLNHYVAGPVDLLPLGGQGGAKDLTLIFDSGSTYTYLQSQAYKATLQMISKDLEGKGFKLAPDDHALPVCWKGPEPFRSPSDANKYFKPLILQFKKTMNKLEIPPEAYLISTPKLNVCLGILNGAEAGLGDTNLIGDISMQNKMVIYNIETKKIGWLNADCSNSPNLVTSSAKFRSSTAAAEANSLAYEASSKRSRVSLYKSATKGSKKQQFVVASVFHDMEETTPQIIVYS
ncbi:Xylanase inhibitor, N-terminal [Dillenia turbinata]|uniref:Xylanase inhibitor, N-terminal n=1 Tax=Dillenia turbinata TaxID=194707 RepID=A0AAN8ZHW8_9MAGN